MYDISTGIACKQISQLDSSSAEGIITYENDWLQLMIRRLLSQAAEVVAAGKNRDIRLGVAKRCCIVLITKDALHGVFVAKTRLGHIKIDSSKLIELRLLNYQ